MHRQPQPIAVFGADTHVAETIWSGRPRLRGDAFFGFSQLVDLALEHRVPLVLAGDCLELLDSQTPTSATVQFISTQIERLRAAELPLYYVSGQHDLASPSWLGAMHPWAEDVSARVFRLGGQDWFGLDYHESRALSVALSAKPKTFGVLLHQRWQELAGGTGNQGSLTQIANSRAVVTGDMHERLYKRVGSLHVFSPGATHKRTVAEPDGHYALVGFDDQSFRWQKLRSRLTLRVAIDPLKEVRRQLDQIGQSVRQLVAGDRNRGLPIGLRQPFVIFDSGGHIEQAYRRLGEDLQDLAHVFTRGKPAGESLVEGSLLVAGSGSSLQRRSHLAEIYEAVVQSAVPDPLVRDILLRVQRGAALSDLREELTRE